MNILAKKLLIKPNCRWLFLNAPQSYLLSLETLPNNVTISISPEAAETYDGMQIFVKDNTELALTLDSIQMALKPDTILWITFPKKNSRVPTNLEMMGNWTMAQKYKLRPVTSIAIDKTWTALRFRPEEQVKKAASRNSEIKNENIFTAFIDVDKKAVTLPADLLNILSSKPAALAYFNGLAYSHKKEYLVWILDAKQEKTKQARITKMLEMLLNNKKNPGAK